LTCGRVDPVWAPSHQDIEDVEHAFVITNLRLACWIFIVWWMHRDLLEHQVKQLIDCSITLNEGFELLQDRIELLRIRVDVINQIAKPFPDVMVLPG
jgi:hypothetical protein